MQLAAGAHIISERTAIWTIAAVVLLVAALAIVLWRVRSARQVRMINRGDLARECSHCGRPLPAGATACPSCGSDMSMFIV